MGWIKAAWGIGKGLYSAYKVWFIIVPVAALLGSFFLYVRNAERNQERLAVALADKDRALNAAKANNTALNECLATNQMNALEAVLQRGRAEAAERNAAKLATHADEQVGEIDREVDTYRTEMDCPALTDAFRGWVRE